MTSMKDTQHPTRTELIDAAGSDSHKLDQHLAACDQCRSLFEFYVKYPVSGQLPLLDAPESWILRAESIAAPSSLKARLKQLAARISFDSWGLPAVAGVRSSGTTAERRIRFETESLVFDLRVEKDAARWNSVARLTATDRLDLADLRLIVNDRTTVANADGFFQWSSSRPPKSLALKSDTVDIALPEISWKLPKQK